MRVVGLEGHVVDPDTRQRLDAVEVLEEAAVDLAVVVGGRRFGHRARGCSDQPRWVLPDVVGAFQEERDPTDLAFGVDAASGPGLRASTPEKMKSASEPTQLPKPMLTDTASGASSEVRGIFVPDPMCRQRTVPVAAHVAKKRSQ